MTLSETLAKAEELLQEAYIKAAARIHFDNDDQHDMLQQFISAIDSVNTLRKRYDPIHRLNPH